MNLSFTSKAQQEAMPIPTHVTLASQSVGRKQILEKLGVRFRVVVSHVEEESILGKDPTTTIKARAEAKLQEIMDHPRVYLMDEKVNNLVIAADSMAILGKKTFGKPKDRDEAKTMLKELMEHTHTFTTAISIGFLEPGWSLKKKIDKVSTTKVTLKKISNPELDIYVSRFDACKYAGAYALNDMPWDLVTRIDGSYTNVIGLPLDIVLPVLKQYEIVSPPMTI
jgi:septum formation protein